MITLKLYSFQKRENSTKLPGTASLTLNVNLLENTSLMKPVFMLSLSSNPIVYNYAYVPDFNRYYFITEVSSDNNFWYLTCEEDCLASFKSQVGAESHYVLRSASEFDGSIIDTLYPAKSDQHCAKYVAPNPLAWSSGHSYVIGIIGYANSSSNQVGSVTYYHMDETALQAFIYFLMHDITEWSDIAEADYDPAVQEALLNPINYIVSCMALPVSGPTTGTVSDIYFGYYKCTLSAGNASILHIGSSRTETTTISKADHPQKADRGLYMNGQPYTSLTAHFGPFGDIELDPSLCLDATGIVFNLIYDLLYGIGRLSIYPNYSTGPATGKLLYVGCTQIGVPINLSQVLSNPLAYAESANNTVLGVLGGALSLATGHISGFTSALSALNTGLADASKLKIPSVSGKGTTGSFLTFFDDDYNCYLKETYFDAVDDNVNEHGRPLCKIKQINTLSGYILCENADCTITGTKDEANKINDFLNGGFFYE